MSASVDVNAHVGSQIRKRRRLLGLTQTQLGNLVGIRFQQIQKYETGDNRVNAQRLWQLSEALGVDVNYFYAGLAAKIQELATANDAGTIRRLAS